MTTSVPIDDELLAVRLRALGHPARLAILRALARAERCHCGEIVRGLPLAQSTVSQHLKILKDAGLIDGTVEGPRSCYCLDRAALAGTLAALGSLGAAMRTAMGHISTGAPIYDHLPGEVVPPASLE
ncbi:metalloregulator ArsR/SmtB family transcription factor [Ancylobacter sp. A5.8]|uniref:ArsR/SmtB family transcription factor n=1 Tax=Ancylobacter gelatini TaxID=2919920 RepID=UPI001F4D6B03|nr:metalloregulator ArsR/SmtB family transcription factor [Ancylobacter gelatini]MCJ8142127.1 metalloregulator ArsR/SmtB family transcription factor [Ancylobacter gelatini]